MGTQKTDSCYRRRMIIKCLNKVIFLQQSRRNKLELPLSGKERKNELHNAISFYYTITIHSHFQQAGSAYDTKCSPFFSSLPQLISSCICVQSCPNLFCIYSLTWPLYHVPGPSAHLFNTVIPDASQKSYCCLCITFPHNCIFNFLVVFLT